MNNFVNPMLVTFILLFASCSKMQELDERTKNMEESTARMTETTSELAKNTGMMYKQKRQVDALFARDELFNRILDKNNTIETKLAYASKFYKSFEFELWNGETFDTIAYREELLEEATSEYFKNMLQIYNKLQNDKNLFGKSKLKRMSPTKLKEKNNYEAAFYALAATMHMKNNHQEYIIENGHQIESLSIYDIMKKALLKEAKGENMPNYMETVITGKNKNVSEELLAARFNFLVALGVTDLTTKEKMGLGNTLNALLFKTSAGKIGKIKLKDTFKDINIETKNQIIKYFDAALKTKKLMEEINLKVKEDKTLKSVLENIELDKEDKSTEELSELILELLK